MVDVRRQVVDTNSINANSLEQSSVPQAVICITEGILSSLRLVTRLSAGLVRRVHLQRVSWFYLRSKSCFLFRINSKS